MTFLALLGRLVLGFLAATGRLARFCGRALSHCVRPPIYFGLLGHQMMRIGYFSLPVVGLTALFTGAVLALQIYIGSSRFNAESIVASIVVIGITRELGTPQAYSLVNSAVGGTTRAIGRPIVGSYQLLCQLFPWLRRKYRFS
jgi:phospholipid/cholesterol/gamma-HCH transport system permease protein